MHRMIQKYMEMTYVLYMQIEIFFIYRDQVCFIHRDIEVCCNMYAQNDTRIHTDLNMLHTWNFFKKNVYRD